MLRQEIPMPVAIGILVAVLLVLGFFVYRSLFAPAPTVRDIPEFQPPPPPAGRCPTTRPAPPSIRLRVMVRHNKPKRDILLELGSGTNRRAIRLP
jgi:hypothetical protein